MSWAGCDRRHTGARHQALPPGVRPRGETEQSQWSVELWASTTDASSESPAGGEEVLRQGPQALGVVGVEGVAGDAVQGSGAALDGLGLVAVDEVASADAFQQRRGGQEDGGGRALLDGLDQLGGDLAAA